jgi:hypothetical protein
MVECDIVLMYIWSCVMGIIYVVGPSVATVQTPRRPFPSDGWPLMMCRGIVYACGALSHTNCCGTHRSDSPVRAS